METPKKDEENNSVTNKSGSGAAGGLTPAQPSQPMSSPAASASAVVEEGKMYALKVTVDGHEHAGQPVKNGATIMLDAADYRWALENSVGVKGNEADAGKEVDSEGKVTAEPTLAELETQAEVAATSAE